MKALSFTRALRLWFTLLVAVALGGCSPASSGGASTGASTSGGTTTGTGTGTIGAPAAAPGFVITALTYNLYTSWFSPAPDPTWDRRLDHAAREIAALGLPDVIALQEVSRSDVPHPVYQRENTAERLARALGGYHVARVATIQLLPVYEEGNAILSRYPIARVEDVWLSAPSATFPRRALRVEITTPAGPVDVVSAHLSGPDIVMAGDLVRWVTARPSALPVLVLGDLNAEPHEPELAVPRTAGWIDAWEAATGSAQGGFTASPRNSHKSPADPEQRIDYVLVVPPAGAPLPPRVLSARVVLDVPDTSGAHASDHFGVLAEIGW